MIRNRSLVPLTLLSFPLGMGIAAGCGGNPEPVAHPSPPPPTATAKAEAPPAAPPRAPLVCAAKEKLVELLAEGPLPMPKEDALKDAVAQSTGSKDGTDAYAKAAPSVVIIRTHSGFGSGAVIDAAKGLILTNYHVVREGLQDDFTVKATVEFGKLSKAGAMERLDTKKYEAKLLKADPIRDLAIIKVENAPKDLVGIKVAKKDVKPAEPVYAIGHANIGMLWGVKGCQVSGIGKSEEFAKANLMDCADFDTSGGDEETKQECKDRQEMQERVLTMLKDQHQGQVVQTDCSITGGDSGGPLVNVGGELVGVNVSVRVDPRTSVSTAKHIHASEVRDFLASIPSEPARMTPDPFCDGGVMPSLEDVDLDGKMDTLLTRNFQLDGRFAMMLDLDQDHFDGDAKKSGAPFDAEVVVLGTPDQNVYVWYDTDNDGRFDQLLVDKGGRGEPKRAYIIDDKGGLKALDGNLPEANLAPELLKDTAQKQRLSRVAGTLQPGWLSFEAARTRLPVKSLIPDALSGGGKKGKARDLDGDGALDSVFLSATFSSGMLLDSDESSLSNATSEAAIQKLLNERKVDAELSVVQQRSNIWVQYDTNNDGRFDLVLYNPDGDRRGYATAAFTLPEVGEPNPAPEHVGRKIFRPALLSTAAQRAQQVLQRVGTDASMDDGLGSLPNPFDGYAFDLRSIKAFPKAVIDVRGFDGSATLIDIDGDGFKAGAKMPESLSAHVRDGKFKPDLALMRRGSSYWVAYDTNADGKFDHFAYSRSLWGKVEQGFKLKDDGKLEPFAWEGKPFKPSVFPKKLVADKAKKLLKEVFNPELIEEK